MKILKIDLDNLSSETINLDNENKKGYFELALDLYLKYENKSPIVFFPALYKYKWDGGVMFNSPITGGLYFEFVSELGHYIKSAGFDFILLLGKSEDNNFLFILNESSIFFKEDLPTDLYKTFEENKEFIRNNYGNSEYITFYSSLSSRNTIYGSIYSIDKGKIHSIGGGIGSLLYSKGIIGLSIGGDNRIEYKNIKNIGLELERDAIYKTYVRNKYNLPYLNYQNIYMNREEFDKFYNNFILDYFLKNKDINKYPYTVIHGLGPFLGIFDLDLIKNLNYDVIKYGFDVKYLSYILGAISEAYSKNILTIKEYEKINFSIKELDRTDFEKNYNFYKNIIEDIANGKLSILGKNLKYISDKLNMNNISFYIDIGNNKDVVPDFFISFGLIFPQVIYNKDFTNYSFIYEDPEKYVQLCKSIFLQKICRNSLERYDSNLCINENIIKKIYEYNYNLGSVPKYFTSGRLLDTIEYLKRYFGLNFNNEDYFNIWYRTYFS